MELEKSTAAAARLWELAGPPPPEAFPPPWNGVARGLWGALVAACAQACPVVPKNITTYEECAKYIAQSHRPIFGPFCNVRGLFMTAGALASAQAGAQAGAHAAAKPPVAGPPRVEQPPPGVELVYDADMA